MVQYTRQLKTSSSLEHEPKRCQIPANRRSFSANIPSSFATRSSDSSQKHRSTPYIMVFWASLPQISFASVSEMVLCKSSRMQTEYCQVSYVPSACCSSAYDRQDLLRRGCRLHSTSAARIESLMNTIPVPLLVLLYPGRKYARSETIFQPLTTSSARSPFHSSPSPSHLHQNNETPFNFIVSPAFKPNCGRSAPTSPSHVISDATNSGVGQVALTGWIVNVGMVSYALA